MYCLMDHLIVVSCFPLIRYTHIYSTIHGKFSHYADYSYCDVPGLYSVVISKGSTQTCLTQDRSLIRGGTLMKRKIHFIAAMVLILVCSSTVPAMERSISDRNSLHALNTEAVPQTGYEEEDIFRVDILDGRRIITPYYSITVPACWRGYYTIETVANETGMWLKLFYRDENGGYCGHLFSILLTDKEDYTMIADYELTGNLEDMNGSKYHVVAVYPTDVQFSRENRNDYRALSNDADIILDTIQPADGYTYTPEPAQAP